MRGETKFVQNQAEIILQETTTKKMLRIRRVATAATYRILSILSLRERFDI